MALLSTLRNTVRYLRPFGIAEAESLMNFLSLGSLRCHCEPTDAAEPRNDRRRSCRTCGNAILATEPTRLYEQLSKAEIRQITRRLRRAGMDSRHVEVGSHLTNLSGLHRAESLADLGSQTL